MSISAFYNHLKRVVYRTKTKVKAKRVYRNNLKVYNEQNQDKRFAYDPVYAYPCLYDRYESNGKLDQYFWQDLWAAKQIAERNPSEHYDIGSRVDGFVAHLASFRSGIHLIDIRSMEDIIPGVDFIQANATNLEGIPDNSVESISALCSLEHFGLGRYGDDVDPNAWEKAMQSIVRVVKKGGYAYIAVPIGFEHVEYDAHRVFYAQTIIDAFSPMQLIEFSCIYGVNNNIERDVPIHKYDEDKEWGGHRFGLFCFQKKGTV